MSYKKNTKLEDIHNVVHRFDISEERLNNQCEDLSLLDLNTQDEHGFTALMIEVLGNEASAVDLLLNHGAATEIENDSGETALMLAIEDGRLGIVEKIIAHADVNYTNMNGDNALGIAKYFGDENIIKILGVCRV